MSLEQSLNELKAAFDQVAHEIELAYPKAWAKANEMYGGDPQAATQLLIAKPSPAWGDVSLLEVAEKYGEDEVVNYIEAVMAGVYM